MKFLKTVASLLAVSCLFDSCAMSYRPINPPTLHYPQVTDSDNISYKYDVLMQRGDRKLAKKEMKNEIRVVAVKIYNNTTQTLHYGKNYTIFAGDRQADILTIPEVTKHIQETVPTYLLYLLFTPTTFNTNSETSSSSFPIGLILGPGLTALNVGIAATANSHFKKEMQEYNILEQDIKPGETAYGLIGMQTPDFAPLTLKWTGN